MSAGFFPPGYFPPDFFGASNPGPTSPGEEPPLSDGGCLRWIAATLQESGFFEEVGVGKNPANLDGNLFPAAQVFGAGFSESDDTDPILIVRTFKFAVIVTIRATDDLAAVDELDRASNLVADLVTCGGPSGYLPGMSKIDSGRYDGCRMNNGIPVLTSAGENLHAMTMLGSMGYLISSRAGRLA